MSDRPGPSTAHMSGVELLNLGNLDREKPWLNNYMAEILGVTFGVATACAINFGTRRPAFSGIQKHIISIVGWSLTLRYFQDKQACYYAEKDAVMRHYIELHPEDFPKPERMKIADILEPWIPIR